VSDALIADVRPLVVLDLDDFQWAALVLRNPKIEAMGTRTGIADQIEAQTKPPRIPEPVQFGVVEAAADKSPGRHKWVRQGDLWWNGAAWNTWDALIDPTLIREGVTE